MMAMVIDPDAWFIVVNPVRHHPGDRDDHAGRTARPRMPRRDDR
jgi:hypothetical protein